MASWKEERDRLVAQTLAFVQHVASAHPAAASKLGLGSAGVPAQAETAPQPSLPQAIEVSDELTVDTPPPAIDPEAASTPPHILAELPTRPTKYSTTSERSAITQRVAAFKERQMTLNREREAYYDSVQARIRSSLRNDRSPNML
jgi:hypothetical protein